MTFRKCMPVASVLKSARVRRPRHYSFDYASESSNSIDDFASKIQAMIKKAALEYASCRALRKPHRLRASSSSWKSMLRLRPRLRTHEGCVCSCLLMTAGHQRLRGQSGRFPHQSRRGHDLPRLFRTPYASCGAAAPGSREERVL